MRFNSPIFYSLLLLAFCYVLLGKIDISFIFFSIALIENSLSLRFYPVSRRVSNQNDFRFSYAEVASKIYYPISLIISYLIYVVVANFYNNSDVKLIFLLVILGLFIIFRITVNEFLDYLEKKNLVKNKNLTKIKEAKDIITNNKNDILNQIKLIKNFDLGIEEKILINDIYDQIKYTSREIEDSILDDMKELNQIISSNTEENSMIVRILKKISNKL